MSTDFDLTPTPKGGWLRGDQIITYDRGSYTIWHRTCDGWVAADNGEVATPPSIRRWMEDNTVIQVHAPRPPVTLAELPVVEDRNGTHYPGHVHDHFASAWAEHLQPWSVTYPPTFAAIKAAAAALEAPLAALGIDPDHRASEGAWTTAEVLARAAITAAMPHVHLSHNAPNVWEAVDKIFRDMP